MCIRDSITSVAPVTTVFTEPVRTVSLTSTPSATAQAMPVLLDIKKEIQGNDGKWYDGEKNDPAAPINRGEKMVVRYTVTNTGKVDLKGVGITDDVLSIEGGTEEDKAALKTALNDQLGSTFDLAAGESTVVTATVNAPKGAHVNRATATAKPVVLPSTSIPRVVVTPVVNNGTTVIGTTVSERPVVQTTVTPPTPTNQAKSTPTNVVPPASPEFKVQKTREQAGNLSLTRNADGKYAYTAEYTIRVTNSGTVDGTHAQVWDAPVRGVGFSVDTVQVDGTTVDPQSGRYLISNGADVKAGEFKEYKVVVSGTVTDEAANALPAAVGQCDAVTPENPGAGSGLVNTCLLYTSDAADE